MLFRSYSEPLGGLSFDVEVLGGDLNHRVKDLQALERGEGAVLPDLVLRGEEVGVSVLFGELGLVDELEALDAGEDEVLGHLAAEAADAGDEDAGGAETLLSVQAPQPDLKGDTRRKV